MPVRPQFIDSRRFADLCAGLLRQGQAVAFTAVGGSMSPLISNGDRVVVEPVVNLSAHQAGSVLLFRASSGGLRLHRLRMIRPSSAGLEFFCQGDAQADGEWVSEKDVLGQLARVDHSFSLLRRLRNLIRRYWWPRVPSRRARFTA